MIRALVGRTGGWLAGFRAGSVNRELLFAAAVVAIATLFVKFLAAAKELAVAYRLGTSAELDAFLMAYVLPSFVVGIITGALQSAFVPAHLEVSRVRGQEAAISLTASFSTVLAVLLVLLSVVLTPLLAASIPYLARGFAPETLRLTRQFLYLLMPVIVLSGMAGLWSGVLNAHKRFLAVALIPVLTPVLIGVLLWLGWSSLGVHGLVVGTLAGGLLELALLCAIAGRLGFRFFADARGHPAEQRQIGRQFVPAAAASLLMGGTLLIDQAMAATLAPGSVAALSFGTRITLMVVGAGTMALATAALPYFSRMVADRDWRGVHDTLRSYTFLIILITVPLTLLMIATAVPVTRLLFERGAFTAENTRLVAQVHALAALQIPFYTWSMLAVRLVASLKAGVFLMWGAAISLLLKAVLNLALGRWLGVAGIALATACVYAISSVFFLIVLHHRLPRADDGAPGAGA